jgi:hypothetical protein
VKVFLLPFDHKLSVFYSEDDTDDGAMPSTEPGLRGWAARTNHRVRSSLRHPKSWFVRKMKQAWDWLQQRMHPDEGLLAALRSAPTIDVYHRSTLPGEEVRGLWLAYLRRRQRRHLVWLIFNTLLAPLSVLLSLLPGPNIIGYWFAYRAVRHLLILLGIRRVLGGRVDTRFHPVAGLDATGDHADRAWLTRAATQFELKGLHDFVERIAPGPSASTAETAGADARGGTHRPCDC